MTQEEIKKWKEERAKKTRGKTDFEIRLMDIQDDCDYQNTQKGNLKYFDCKKCQNRGYFYGFDVVGELIYKKQIMCDCNDIRNRMYVLEQSGLAEIIKDKNFDNFSIEKQYHKAMKEMAKTFVQNTGDDWFYIGGQVGCGKTHICTAIMGYFLNKGIDCVYVPYRQEISALKRMVSDGKSYDGVLDNWKRAKILYIDDFFKGNITEADKNIIFDLIDYRYRNKLKTIISSEMACVNVMDIDEAIGSRVYQRAKNMNLFIGKDKNKNERLT